MTANPAYVRGPKDPALWIKTLGTALDEQAARFGDKSALIVPWQSVRLSYRQLADRSRVVAKALLRLGLRHGDSVGIMAGNCHEYIEVFLGGARIGCPVVVLNNTYSPDELRNAACISSCKVIFIASKIGTKDLAAHIAILRGQGHPNPKLLELLQLVCLGNDEFDGKGIGIQSYTQLKVKAAFGITDEEMLRRAEARVDPDNVLNLQFTSGTTGAPKAAMLTHVNLLNNGLFIGDALRLTPDDIVCCPPPLFHCFGLVVGFLSSLSHGCAIVFPSDNFDAKKVVDAVMSEDATIILSVPTMFMAQLEVMAKSGQKPRRLRAGLSAGAALSVSLIAKVREKMGLRKIINAYGMTETSPITFMTVLDDSDDKAETIGRVMPHTAAKVIDSNAYIFVVNRLIHPSRYIVTMPQKFSRQPPGVSEAILITFPAPNLLLVTLNRPQQLNAMPQGSHRAFSSLELWSEKNRAGIPSHGADGDSWLEHGFGGMSNRRGKEPIIAAVSGYCFGGGFEVMLNSDCVIASESAKFGLPRASEMTLLGRTYTAQTLYEWGILSKVLPENSVLDEALRWAAEVAAQSPDAIILNHAGLLGGWDGEDPTLLSNHLPIVTTDPNALEEQARGAMETKSFKYIYRGAGELSTMDANRLAFRQWRIIPRVLKPASPRDLTTELFCVKYDSPLLVAPVGVQAMFHSSGERGLIAACAELGIPYILSTAATQSIETIAEACGPHPRWYQLYWPKDNDITRSLVLRAKNSGFSALVVTLDTVTVAWRPHDLDIANLPFLEGIGNAVGFSDPVFREKFYARSGKTPEEDQLGASRYWISEVFAAEHHSWEDLELLRELWEGPIVLKGVLSAEDARLALQHGVDGIVVSNHGGRQIDGGVSSLEMLPEVVEAVGDRMTILFDSGIRTGSDIIKAIALGAQAVFVGRPALYGSGIAGKEGAYEVLAGLLADMEQCMAIAGFQSIADLKPSIIRKV
ncbi:hypothetical protein SAPIO_CDS6390 [Scedosporium apiospermum]|uniref:FMN hydroxy acid dehydrogenase domain-containing protein n=1 Tax=Pseudallescheria apiosperma TaxID=563466 RepID=A0A084G3T6_PSEDA|nr:uncharacterized protein SAPIO_CDS6390 [Scedosporium apiospermum]KEZ41998.1 hypothetical protein SAPIO_CDS6390 [Scedosporium apiospermum]